MCARGQTRADGGAAAVRALQVTKRDVSGSSAPWNLRDRDDIRRAIPSPSPSLLPPPAALSVCLSARAISPFRAHEFNPRGISRASRTSRSATFELGGPRVQRLSTPAIARGRSDSVDQNAITRCAWHTGCVPVYYGHTGGGEGRFNHSAFYGIIARRNDRIDVFYFE